MRDLDGLQSSDARLYPHTYPRCKSHRISSSRKASRRAALLFWRNSWILQGRRAAPFLFQPFFAGSSVLSFSAVGNFLHATHLQLSSVSPEMLFSLLLCLIDRARKGGARQVMLLKAETHTKQKTNYYLKTDAVINDEFRFRSLFFSRTSAVASSEETGCVSSNKPDVYGKIWGPERC